MKHTSSSSSAALQPGVGFGLLYKVIPLLSISNKLLPVLHLGHLHIDKTYYMYFKTKISQVVDSLIKYINNKINSTHNIDFLELTLDTTLS